ncbi:MAG: hypothetical protein ACRDT4_02350 [Micromonosporaceae bacterium]
MAEDNQSTVVRQLLAVVGNITVVTALLIYFGWRRSETQAQQLGIDESILGMSTQDYILRSVGPVLALLVTVAITGLVWLWADRLLFRRANADHRLVRRAVWVFTFGWLIVPGLVWLAGYVKPWKATAFIAWPLAIAAGILLTMYAAYLQRTLLDPDDEIPDTPRHEALARGFAAVLIGTCLFWSASNYAEILGRDLAQQYAHDVTKERAVKVVVYSPHRLHLTAPEVTEEALPAADSAYKFRYRGLLLLDHTGSTYFLISEGWTRSDGVVLAIPDDGKIRLEFVRGSPSEVLTPVGTG